MTHKIIRLIIAAMLIVGIAAFSLSESEVTMPYIPQVKVGNTIYNLKDTEARAQITDFMNDVTNAEFVSVTTGAYIDNTAAVVNLTPVSYAGYGYAVVDCEEGDVFIVSGRGSVSPRLWAFIDENNNNLGVSSANLEVTGLRVTAPKGAVKAVFGFYITPYPNYRVFKQRSNADFALVEDMCYITSSEQVTINAGAYIDNTTDVVDLNPISYAGYAYAVSDCEEGDVFIVSGRGSVSPRLWAFIDENNVNLRTSAPNLTAEGLKITAPARAAKAVFGFYIKPYPNYRVFKQTSNTISEESVINNTGKKEIVFVEGLYISTSGNTIVLTPITYRTAAYAVTPCEPDDIFLLKGQGMDAAAVLWTFTDSEMHVIAKDTIEHNTYGNYIALTAPANAAYLICNSRNTVSHKLFKLVYSGSDVVKSSFMAEEFIHGSYDSHHQFIQRSKLIVTKDYLDPSIYAVVVNNPNVRMYTMYWLQDGTPDGFETDDGLNYKIYNHIRWKYKVIFEWLNSTEPLMDVDAILSCVTVLRNQQDMVAAYRRISHEKGVMQEQINGLNSKVKALMRKDYDISYANAIAPIDMKAYVGNNQLVHPKVLYFPNGLFGHKYWMAYTPCAFSNSAAENPCIAYSEDGYKWYDCVGNPLDDKLGDGYNSDTHLVYREDMNVLECWYRYISDTSNPPVSETLRRRTTQDGLNWTAEETLYVNSSGSYAKFLSPSIIFENNKYCMWVENADNNPRRIDYYESANATNWTLVRSFTPTFKDEDNNTYFAWHADVIHDNDQYILCVMCKPYDTSVKKWPIFILTSSDNVTYSVPRPIMFGSKDGWDQALYRPSIVNVDGKYRIYYTGMSSTYKSGDGSGGRVVYGVGITESDTLENFIGY